jgi:hypothetical protein
MQSIRRTFLALTVSLLAIVVGSGTAFAGPKPLTPSDSELITPEKTSSSGGFLDSWPQVTLSIVVIAAVLAFAVVAMPRLRHRSPTSATTA